jgi:Domain of unknown function (DUF4386)
VKEVQMTSPDISESQVAYARLAGFMYLFVDAAYAVGLWITSGFRVSGNIAATAHRIMAAALLYRIGLSSLLLGGLCTVFLATGLYVATKPIDDNLALLALVFRVVEATLFGVLAISNFMVVTLYIDADSMKSLDGKELSVLVNLHSVASSAGFNIAAIFFSMGSILFFYLFFKASSIPRSLATLGLVGSVLVPMICFGSLIAPQHARMLQFGWAPIGIAEVLVGLWLLVKGVNDRPRDNSRSGRANEFAD